ncbi:putative cellulose hydrolase [Aspergillus clavatus NRRL 1]|uniref:Cellulose hydrolase, putative n=1 Tax=Aspergillus clavatus (strain ATCC 1007 / CBS 513.65 / DSM 816 / NCTC 3887 / NRRL 1 / QM 1276 / 107) TaxID=344612 RepID=A1C6U9_ASPCL|nr:cellulose hydrolase, putative [Aspergillus clavatus NRRL 1]EAW14120.1 cellulose hydrolase, putative [Aspergillus clavatus NRRL 1]
MTLLILLAGLATAASALTATVNTAQTYQTMDGFGFSQAFGRAYDLYNIPSDQRDYALDLLFSPTKGAGMTILRNRIGSSSGDSILPNSPGSPNSIPHYKALGTDSVQVWVTQQAVKYGVKTIYADAWSAPAFMKTNGEEKSGGYLCGVTGKTCPSGDWKQAYANYLVQYIKDYAELGLDISHVGFLNEPDYTVSYSSMLSDGTQAADFIKVLHPTLQKAGLSHVGITCCDATGWSAQKTRTAELIAANAEGLLSRITSHSYSSDPTSPMGANIPVWQTETADLSGAWETTWHSSGGKGEGLTWAEKIHTAITQGGVSAYLYWEGFERATTNACLVITDGKRVIPSGRLWAFGHWSRYVRPGAVRVAISGSTSTLKMTAFKNKDGTVSVQIINTGPSASEVTVAGFAAASAKAYLTDNNHAQISETTVSVNGGKASVNVPGHAFVTVVLSGNGSRVPPSLSPATKPETKPETGNAVVTGRWSQCGGQGWTGPTACAAPYTCKAQNPWYSQCL